MNREEHLQWCKDRALKYVESNDLYEALDSMTSDLRKHDGTRSSVMLCVVGFAEVHSKSGMRRFINGFK